MYQAFSDSFMSGFHLALIVAGAVLLAAAVVANIWIPSGPYRRPEQAIEAGAEPVPAH